MGKREFLYEDYLQKWVEGGHISSAAKNPPVPPSVTTAAAETTPVQRTRTTLELSVRRPTTTIVKDAQSISPMKTVSSDTSL